MPYAEAAPPAGISVERLTKAYGRTRVLHGLDLAVRPGAFICLLGPSGCGKTTLLRCIAGLERPDTGRIAVGERVVVDIAQKLFMPPEQRRLGMVFQHYALWPHMTVAENIEYPLRKQGVSRTVRAERVQRIMRTVGLPDVLGRRPGQLSGGQQQRVALARALVYEPPVLLLDEPLSNLDATLRGQLRRELRQLHERLGTTTVLVTHDQEEAASLADTIVVMNHGDVMQAGPAHEVLEMPRTRFVAEFVGFDNMIAGRVDATEGDRVRVALGGGEAVELPMRGGQATVGAAVFIAARSDSLRLAPDGATLGAASVRGIVHHVARIGRGLEFEIACGDQTIVVRETGYEPCSALAHAFAPGSPIQVDFLHSRSVVVANDPAGLASRHAASSASRHAAPSALRPAASSPS